MMNCFPECITGLNLPEDLYSFGFATPEQAECLRVPLDETDCEQIERVRILIGERFRKTKRVQTYMGSEELRYLVERWLKIYYLPEGQFIAAMIAEGFGYKRNGAHCWFNISKESWIGFAEPAAVAAS